MGYGLHAIFLRHNSLQSYSHMTYTVVKPKNDKKSSSFTYTFLVQCKLERERERDLKELLQSHTV